jgi:hypothetical protein
MQASGGGLKVDTTRKAEGSPARATIRYWSKVHSALLLMAGFMMIGFTSRNEGRHHCRNPPGSEALILTIVDYV